MCRFDSSAFVAMRRNLELRRGIFLPSVGSRRFARRPCFELLWTNMLSDTAKRLPSTLGVNDMTTFVRENCQNYCQKVPKITKKVTWNRRMSRGFPAFFRQFWLHFRKNLRKNLKSPELYFAFGNFRENVQRYRRWSFPN